MLLQGMEGGWVVIEASHTVSSGLNVTCHMLIKINPCFSSLVATVHTSYNLNVTRMYHACVDHEIHTRFCYTRVLSCVFIPYTTNT